MVTITCSHSTQYSLDFSEGTSGDAPTKLEEIDGPSSITAVTSIYKGSAHNKNGINQSDPITLPSKQFAVPASSSDTVTATVTY
jgi:hypothetical protein